MMELVCIGHDASYEVGNIVHLFSPYTTDEMVMESCLESNEAIATIKESASGMVKVSTHYKIEWTQDELKDKRLFKEALKKAAYDALVQVTGQEMPWGILTGIRPTKLVHDLLKQGADDVWIDQYLEEQYKVSSAKRLLMREVAKQEMAVLEKNQPDEMSLYIGIPFCPTRCVYCSFTAYSLEQKRLEVEPYLRALFKEISFVAKEKEHLNIRSLYIGGGTPTSLNEDQLERLLSHVETCFDLTQIEEYTLEAGRPDTITREKLKIMKAHGVGRISINPQSMNQKTLDAIGRRHGVEDICRVFEMAREEGHDNINMDVILGLPGESVEDVAYTLKALHQLGPENITVHTMAVKRASKLKEALHNSEEDITLTEGQKIQQMLALCEAEMASMGLKPYYMYRQKNMLGNFENVGYAKPGTEGIYNIEIMEEAQSIIALGAGAITKIVYQNGEKIDRIPNVKSLKDYIERIDEMIERKRIGFRQYQ